MPKIKLPIVGPAYTLQQTAASAQTRINLYPHVIESPNGDRVSMLLPTAGLTLERTLSGACRGLYALATGDALCVSGGTLYRLPADGSTAVILGAIAGLGLVSIADNGQQAVIVTGGEGYWVDLSTWVLTKIVNSAFYGADFVDMVAGRFVFNRPSTGQFYWSGLYAVTFDGLAFATAESSPDLLVALIQHQDQLWLIGKQTTEVHYSTGDQDLPYLRLQGAAISAGCVAPRSLCRFGSSLVWLSQTEAGSGQVIMMQGYQPQRISTHAIEQAISSYSRIDDATAYAYQQDGHAFYVLTFPAANVTWCYDATTQLWHQRAGFAAGAFLRHRTQQHCMYRGGHLVGDYLNGNVYTIDRNAALDHDQNVVCERAAAVIGNDGAMMRFNALELVCPVGVGGSSFVLDWSKDQGRTWSDGVVASMGDIGAYETRVLWRRLGASRERIFRVRFDRNQGAALIDCRLQVST